MDYWPREMHRWSRCSSCARCPSEVRCFSYWRWMDHSTACSPSPVTPCALRMRTSTNSGYVALSHGLLHSRRVPNGRSPRAFLQRRRLRRCNAQFDGIEGGPARCWDFDHTRVIEGRHGRVELTIRPHRHELRVADIVGIARRLDVHRIS